MERKERIREEGESQRKAWLQEKNAVKKRGGTLRSENASDSIWGWRQKGREKKGGGGGWGRGKVTGGKKLRKKENWVTWGIQFRISMGGGGGEGGEDRGKRGGKWGPWVPSLKQEIWMSQREF